MNHTIFNTSNLPDKKEEVLGLEQEEEEEREEEEQVAQEMKKEEKGER